LGGKYEMEIEEISKSREEYQSEAYKTLGWPPAPALMVEDELAGRGAGLSEEQIEAVIRRHLGLPPLAAKNNNPAS
jgi:hypothetical protein